MTRFAAIAALLMAGTLSVTGLAAAERKANPEHRAHQASRPAKTWTFESSKPGETPSGFLLGKTGGGPAGRWIVEDQKGAPSGRKVLAQLDANPASDRMLVAVANEPVVRDLSVSVTTKTISGKVDEDSGLVFRYQDEKNYYVARADALKHDIVLSSIKDSKAQEIMRWEGKGKVSKGAWHTMSVVAKGDHIQVLWDGARVINAHDKTFLEPGKAGVWTKADSVSYYDNLRVRPLA